MKMIDPKEFVRGELTRLNIAVEQEVLGRYRSTIWFKAQPGFGLRKYPTGREVYFTQTRMDGRQRSITICDARLISFQAALDIARRCIYQSEQLPNAADTRKRKRSTPLFQDFLKTYWRTISPKWKLRTLVTETYYRLKYLMGAFDKVGIDELSHEQVQAWFISSNRKGSPGAANRAFDRVRAVLNKAEEWGLREEGTNPCTEVEKNKRRKYTRFLSEVEFGQLGTSLAKYSKKFPLQVIVIQLLLTTGCRRDEIRCMKWTQVKGTRLMVIDGKTGDRTVQLCADARMLLSCLKRGKPDDYVFACSTGGPTSLEKCWKIIKEDCGLFDVRLHDLRHSYASRAARLGVPLPVSKQLLGHVRIENTAIYTHYNDEHLIEIANSISELIDEEMQGRGSRRRA